MGTNTNNPPASQPNPDLAGKQRLGRLNAGPHLHRLLILECLQEVGPISRVELARRTGLGQATVNRLVAGLLAAGLVRDAGEGSSTGGRPSLLVAFNPNFGHLLCLDIADHHTDIALVDLLGRIVRKTRQLPEARTGPERLEHTLASIRQALSEGDNPPILAVGIAVPSAVGRDGAVSEAVTLGWYDIPLRRQVGEMTGLPTAVDNDANLMALAEYSFGPWQGVHSLVCLAVLDGVGSGIVENGQVWRGANGNAGEIGRMLTSLPALGKTYDGFGDLELHLGRIGIAGRARQAGLTSLPGAAGLDEAFDRALAGEPRAEEFLQEILEEYAFSLVNLCALLSPELITFSGAFETWSSLVIPRLGALLQPQVAEMPRLEPSSTSQEGALLGAFLQANATLGGLDGLVHQASRT